MVRAESRIHELSASNLWLIFSRDYWWPSPHDYLYRPVTLLSLLFNYVVLGNAERPPGYHFVNFLLHALNSCLLFFLVRRLLSNRTVAFFAAALWAIHPVATESVTNISGRADLLAASGIFAAMALHAASQEWIGRRRRIAYAGLFALTLFGGLSKESGLVTPALLFLWDTLDLKRLRLEVRLRAAAYLSSAAAIGVIFLLRQHAFSSRVIPFPPYLQNPLVTTDFWTARLTAIKVLGMQLWLLLFPLHLSSDRTYRQIPFSTPGDIAVWISLAAICAVAAIALVRYRKDRAIYFAVGFTAITLLPTSNLLRLIGSIFAERFLYVPAAGFAIALAALAFRIPRPPRTAEIAIGVVLVLYGMRTYARNFDWRDDFTLRTADVHESPQSYRLHDLLGRSLFVQNTAANIDRSIREGETAWEMLRPLPAEWIPADTLYHLGFYYTTKGEQLGSAETAEGRSWYEKAIPMLVRSRDVSLASEHSFDRLQLEHGKPLPGRTAEQITYKTLGLVYSRMNRHQDALQTLIAGRNVNPDTAEYYLLIAREYHTLGDDRRAAMTMLEDMEIEGVTEIAINGVREAAGAIPEASCAVQEQGNRPALNNGCEWVRKNRCTALDDLAKAYEAARHPLRAAGLRQSATQAGCPAQ
jgi:tetratricopeptide (TPR) repeat protein